MTINEKIKQLLDVSWQPDQVKDYAEAILMLTVAQRGADQPELDIKTLEGVSKLQHLWAKANNR
jgi:hypothetical protein